VRRAAERVESELGEIDVWVNVAFVGSLAFSWDTSMEEFRRMTEVTYYGQVHGTQAALQHMRPRNRGVIVNVCSAMAYRSIPLQAAYCGGKHAVVGYSESVMTELAHERSRVKLCMVQLPGVNTPQFNWNLNKMARHPMPVPPIFQPELPAKAIVFLAEHPRRNMWVGISTAYTILGERIAPKLLDVYLGRTGVKSQQTGGRQPRWGSNVFEAQDDQSDRGSHGGFDDQAHAGDPMLWASMHRRAPRPSGTRSDRSAPRTPRCAVAAFFLDLRPPVNLHGACRLAAGTHAMVRSAQRSTTLSSARIGCTWPGSLELSRMVPGLARTTSR
jgi:short-subunit dehydrogenase